MQSTSRKKTTLLAEYAVLTALVIVLQVFANVLSFGPIQFTLSLVPLVVGAILVGPLCSTWLGFVLGIVNLVTTFSNPVLTFLFHSSPVLYVLTCVGKTVLAGLAAGWIFRLLKDRNEWLGVILAAVATPVVNTGVFFVMMILFFRDAIASACQLEEGADVIAFVLTAFIGFNFFVELGLNVALAPAFNGILHGVRSSRRHTA